MTGPRETAAATLDVFPTPLARGWGTHNPLSPAVKKDVRLIAVKLSP